MNRRRPVARAVVVAAALLSAAGPAIGREPGEVAPEAPGARWQVEPLGGTLPLPKRAPLADGGDVAVSGVSGITWLGGDRYAAVMDNTPAVVVLSIPVGTDGRPAAVTAVTALPLGAAHDYEDVAAWPQPAPDAADASGVKRLYVAEEDTPAVRMSGWPEARLDGGLRLPRVFRRRRPNRGVEAVAADPDGRHVWAANEEALETDGPGPTASSGTVVRIVKMPIEAPADPSRRAPQFGYSVAPPHRFVGVAGSGVYAGLVALVALGDGALLVLERSGCPGLPPFGNRIELVETAGAADVSGTEAGLDGRAEGLLAKTTLWAGTVHANLEGLCIGPHVPGGRLLLGVTDDGGLTMPSELVAFLLRGPGDGEPAPATSP